MPAKTAEEAKVILATHQVTQVSFDHDLGCCPGCTEEASSQGLESSYCPHNGTGYEVATWLEEQIYNDPNFPVPVMTVHSDNGPGILNIKLAIQSILRIASNRE